MWLTQALASAIDLNLGKVEDSLISTFIPNCYDLKQEVLVKGFGS